MTRMQWILAGGLLSSLTACSQPSPANPSPYTAFAENEIAHPDQPAPPRLSGSKLWQQNCMRCHMARPTNEFRADQWDVIMLHMRVRAGLTARESRAILEFLRSGR